MDVLIDKCAYYAYNHPDLKTDYQRLFADLYDRRHREMINVLTDQSENEMKKELKKAKEEIGKISLDETQNWNDYVDTELSRRQRKLIKEFQKVNFKDYPRVHHVRKRAKTLRYSATYFAGFDPKRAKKSKKIAESVQDICGNITAAHVNQKMLADFAKQTDDAQERSLLMSISNFQNEILSSRVKKEK